MGKFPSRRPGQVDFPFRQVTFLKPHLPNGQEFKQVILLQNLLVRLACNDPGQERRASYLS